MTKHLESSNLVPFKRRSNGYQLPILARDEGEQIIDDVDPELRPEEQSFVRHYLGYADVMLKNAEEEAALQKPISSRPQSVTEFPRRDKDHNKDDAA